MMRTALEATPLLAFCGTLGAVIVAALVMVATDAPPVDAAGLVRRALAGYGPALQGWLTLGVGVLIGAAIRATGEAGQ